MTKLYEVIISLPEELIAHIEAEDEDEARVKSEDVILRAMEKGTFEVEITDVGFEVDKDYVELKMTRRDGLK